LFEGYDPAKRAEISITGVGDAQAHRHKRRRAERVVNRIYRRNSNNGLRT